MPEISSSTGKFTLDRYAAAREGSREKGIHFSAWSQRGEEGALKGPSIMPGGSKEGWQVLAPIYTKIAAVAENEPCCRYMDRTGPATTSKWCTTESMETCGSFARRMRFSKRPSIQTPRNSRIFDDWNKGQLNLS
jgi:6-phosphogluconate dehydrogenase